MHKAILTGLGARGLYWLGNVRRRDDLEVVAFVEPFEASIERAVNEHGVERERIFPSLDAAIESTSADFVLDVTPPRVHHEVALRAFEAGLHVLGEKPLSDSFAHAREVVRAGQKAGLRHMITQNYRFSAPPRTTRAALDAGLLGRVGQADIRFYKAWGDYAGTHYVTEPFMLINDMMVHHFDMLRYVLGEDPESVHAITWNQPWGWHAGDACHVIVFRYASGLVTTHTAIACEVGSQTQWNGDWHIAGEKGSIDWIDDQVLHSHCHRTDEIIEKRPLPPLDVPAVENAMIDEFLAAITENREPECSASDNLASLAMVFAAIQSAKEGRAVRLDELG